jgi:hypothetical protein
MNPRTKVDFPGVGDTAGEGDPPGFGEPRMLGNESDIDPKRGFHVHRIIAQNPVTFFPVPTK